MQLNILADGQIGDAIGVAAGEVSDGAELPRSHHAVGDADANHETLQRLPYSALAAGYARAVTLGINAPPAEISSDPFGRDRLKSLASEAPDFIQAVPRIGGPLEALDSLRCSFFCQDCHRSL